MPINTAKPIEAVIYNGTTIPVLNPSTGTINITSNGTADVTQYASANVNVSGGSGGNAYHTTASSDYQYTGTLVPDTYTPGFTPTGVTVCADGSCVPNDGKIIYARTSFSDMEVTYVVATSDYDEPYGADTGAYIDFNVSDGVITLYGTANGHDAFFDGDYHLFYF